MDWIEELKKIVKGKIKTDSRTLGKYSTDASLFEIKPKVVFFPKDKKDIQRLVKFVGENKGRYKDLSITICSGGSDMTGGPLSESIVVDVSQCMDRLIKVKKEKGGGGYAIVQPGMAYRDFEKQTLKKRLLMPSYPASRELCTVGGMVANNAGGEKTLKYGKTLDYVQEVKIILRDGNEYAVGSLTQKQLDKKIAKDDVEGDLYKKIDSLIRNNKKVIEDARPNVSKNSAGYYLWNVWDGKKFNLAKLIVGSQGTLGIITEIRFRLIEPKRHSTLLIIFLKDISQLAEVVGRVLKHKPESFESYDDQTMKVAMRFLPSLIKLMGAGGLISLAWQFRREFFMALTGGLPKLILEAEFTGDSEKEIYAKAYAAQADLEGMGFKTRVTKGDTKRESDLEERKYWVVRRESFNLLRHHAQGRQTAPFIDDIVVRPEVLPEFWPELQAILKKKEYKLLYTVAGHIGDGNFHIIPLMDLSDEKNRKIIPKLSKEIYSLVLKYGGSITGEHNDGLIRGPFLKQMYGAKVYTLFKEVKKIFDPDNIFNPGKKVGGTLEYAMSHLKKTK